MSWGYTGRRNLAFPIEMAGHRTAYYVGYEPNDEVDVVFKIYVN